MAIAALRCDDFPDTAARELACDDPATRSGGLSDLATRLGYDGLSYLLLVESSVAPVLLGHWSTAGSRWTARYAARRLHLADPRISRTRGRCVPVIWSDDEECLAQVARPFLQEARQVPIRGGIALSLHDVRLGRIVIAWDLAGADDGSCRESKVRADIARLTLVAGFIHEAMFDHCRSALSQWQASALTLRELQCLGHAAHGMTSADIATKLAITERTVNFHIGNTLSKLGALNRGEAIARAMAMKLVSAR